MASETRQIQPTGLARRLVVDKLLSEQQAQSASMEAARKRQPFVQYLVQEKLVDSHNIAVSAALEFGIPLLDLDAVDLMSLPSNLVDEKLIRKHRVLPLHRRGNRLFIAVSDPTNDQALDEIRFNTGNATDAILVEESKLSWTKSASIPETRRMRSWWKSIRGSGHHHERDHGLRSRQHRYFIR
jgi:type IV pilus assembly protein PilB